MYINTIQGQQLNIKTKITSSNSQGVIPPIERKTNYEASFSAEKKDKKLSKWDKFFIAADIIGLGLWAVIAIIDKKPSK